MIPPSVFLGFTIRNKQIRFTAGYATGLKIQRIQKLGLQIPVACRNFYAYNEHIRWVGVAMADLKKEYNDLSYGRWRVDEMFAVETATK